MGHKSVCIDCRKALNREFDSGSGRLYPCPECGNPMILLPHRFRPAKKTDDEKWRTVKYLIENGFLYQHLYKETRYKNMDVPENYIDYPETLREAKEFVEKYKERAIKKPNA